MNQTERSSYGSVSRIFASGLILLTPLMMSACGGIGSEDDSTKAQVLRDSEKLQQRYDLAVGTYRGKISNPATGLRPLNATLFIYTIPIVDGRHADGTPKVRPELHGRFQLDDYPTETDVTNMVGDYDEAGKLSLAAAAPASGAAPNPISLIGQILDKKVTAAVSRQGGDWGNFTGIQTSNDASAPAEGDVEEERERYRRLYHTVEGTYTARIQAPKGNGFAVMITVSQTDQGIVVMGAGAAGQNQVLLPALAAHFRRLDVIPGNGIGEYTMVVDYNALTGTVIMQSVTPDKAIPGSSQVSVRGTLQDHILKAEVRNSSGIIGTIIAHATNIPPQQ